jgi:hypothetical protein
MMMTAEAAWIRVWARRVGQRPEIKREFLLPSCSVSTLRSLNTGIRIPTSVLDQQGGLNKPILNLSLTDNKKIAIIFRMPWIH